MPALRDLIRKVQEEAEDESPAFFSGETPAAVYPKSRLRDLVRKVQEEAEDEPIEPLARPEPPPPSLGFFDTIKHYLDRIEPRELGPGGVGMEGVSISPPVTEPLERDMLPPHRPTIPTDFLSEFARRTRDEVVGGVKDIPAGGQKVVAPESTMADRLMGVLQTAFAIPRIVFSPMTAAVEQAYDGAFDALPDSVKNTPITLPVVGETTVQALSESLGKPMAVNLAFIALGKMQLKAADMAKTTAMRETLKKQGLIEAPEATAARGIPPPEMDIPPRPEAGPIYPTGVQPGPKALPPAPAIAVTPEGQAIPRPGPKAVPMSADEIAASRANIAPSAPPQTFKGKTYGERLANASAELAISQSQLKRAVKDMITKGMADTADEALAMIAARKRPPPPQATIPEPSPVTPPAGEIPVAGSVATPRTILTADALPEYAKLAISDAFGGESQLLGSRWVEETMPLESVAKRINEGFSPRPSVSKGPIVLDDKGVIIDGHNRVAEAINRGDKNISVFRPLRLEDVPPAATPAVQAPISPVSLRAQQAVVEPTAQPSTWASRIDKKAPSALKSRAAKIDTVNLTDFDAGGIYDYLGQMKLKLFDEANRRTANLIMYFESAGEGKLTAKQLASLPGALNRGTKDSGMFQISPPLAKQLKLPKATTAKDQLRQFERAVLPYKRKVLGTEDPKALALGHLNERYTKPAIQQGGTGPVVEDLTLPKPPQSTVGAAQYKPPPYTEAELATGPRAELPGEVTTTVWTVDTLKPLGRQVEQLFNGELPNPDAKFFRNVGAAIKRGEIVLPGQKQIMDRHGLTVEQLGDHFLRTETTSGQHLNLLSQWKKKMNQFARENPELAKEMGVDAPPPREPIGWFKKMDNTTRALMTGRIGTAVRNFWSGTGYYSLDAVDNAIANVVTGAKKGNVAQEMSASMERLSAIGRSLSPSKQKELTRILDAFPLEKMELVSAPIQDVVIGGKFVNLVQTWNRAQEIFVRRLAFDASVKEGMIRRGLKFDPANPAAIPADLIEQGVKDALRITMAAKPEKGTVIGDTSSRILRAYNALPVLSLINPFPRFQYANAFRFLWEHSPVGPIDLLTKGRLAQEVTASGKPTLAALAARKELANPKTAALAFSKAATGLGLFTVALAYRSSDNAPDKWYEIKAPSGVPVIGGKPVSGEAFAPFITYALFAEGFRAAVHAHGTQEMKEMFNTINKPPVVEVKDLARAAIGLNRIAGTGLVFVDLMQKGAGERGWKNVMDFFGQYLGRVTVPLSSYKNLISPLDPEEAQLRDVTTAPVTGPIRRNVPMLDKTLPPSPSMTRDEPRTIEHPVFGELTGLGAKTYTQLEHEINRLNIPWYELGPRTGVPEADLQLKEYMGILLDQDVIEGALQAESFQNGTDPMKERQLRKLFGDAREKALRRLKQADRELYQQVMEKKRRKDIELIESYRPELGPSP